ncbi:uncharacterized protein [Argopecten irradians]|uniref:uncharacterized protein n=1 Tax=Argopecten irradians TaxID=31199 RepID=UPI003718818A
MDSPGHSAQYCTYSLMELDSNKIMSIVTVDKRETGKVSTVMEKLGFKRALEDLLSKNVKIAEIATDQHMQISSLMKKERPDIKHSFDVWHGAKNLGKKINAASQQKEAKDLQKWTSHITNHFWHACKEAKDEYDFRGIWLGVVHHVVDVHQWILSGGGNRTKCSHGPLETEEKKWSKKGSKAHEALQKIAYDKRFLNNIKYYLNFRSTASLESFNQLILMYAAKRYSYTPPVYKARCQLAAIDNNYHADRDVKISKDGSTRMHRVFNKKSKRWTVSSVKEEKDYGYLDDLAKRVIVRRLQCRGGMSCSATLAQDDPRRLSKTIAP